MQKPIIRAGIRGWGFTCAGVDLSRKVLCGKKWRGYSEERELFILLVVSQETADADADGESSRDVETEARW